MRDRRQSPYWRPQLAVLSMLLVLCCGTVAQAGVPLVGLEAVQAGFSLKRPWQFRVGDDMAWADPQYDSADWGERMVPERWPVGGFPDTRQLAWYRITLQLDLQGSERQKELGQLAVRLGKILSAYEIYAGGQLLGGEGKLPPVNEVDFDRMQVFSIPPDAVAPDGTLVLALRVWGGETEALGFWRAGPFRGDFKLGDHRTLLLSGLAAELPGLLVGVLFLGFGCYHLYLYSRNKQLNTYLWYGLLAIDIGIYSLMLTQWKFMFDWPFLVFKKIELGAIYLFPALAAQMTWSLLQQPVRVWLRVYQSVFVGFFIVLLVVPGQAIIYQTLPIWQYLTVPILLVITWLIVRQALAENREARTVVVGVLFFVATCINDLVIDLFGIGSTRLVPFGFVAVMLAMSASLADRLTATLAGLEKAVARRTEALSQANEQLAAAARIDPLTNLLNRRGFSAEATEEIHRMHRSGRGFNLVLADIDQFKDFNDCHGHACGDHVLMQVASIFQTKLRAVDRVGRWGGEEFIVLLPETDLQGACSLAEKLRQNIAEQLFEFSGRSFNITMTFGVSTFQKGETLDSCIARADAALYRGKNQGRNNVMGCVDEELAQVDDALKN